MKINNSALIPKILPDEQVELITAEAGGKAMTPDWVKTLIMQEIHIETATPAGTFEAAVEVLDHYAEMGVNGIWVTPIYEKGPGGNGYGNTGPHRVEPALTGTDDQEKCWQAVKTFVDEAHRRNIRVLLDVITWGTMKDAPLTREHPDWYDGTAWGNVAFNWKNEELRQWFVKVCTENLLKTGADGYRCDCEPNHTGYTIFNQIRENCAAAGRKVMIMAEDGCLREDCYDMEQDGVLSYLGWDRGAQYKNPRRFYLEEGFNIVDSVKSGQHIGCASLQHEQKSGRYRWYTYCVSNHDFEFSIVNGNRLVMGYQAIFAPFIPLWYYGAEFNMQQNERQVIYFVPVTKDEHLAVPENREFFEDIKAYIRIRRTYPEIFEVFPEDHREANMAKVEAEGISLQAYARYADGKAILVVGNPEKTTVSTRVHLPMELFAEGKALAVTDLMAGRPVEKDGTAFAAEIAGEHIGVYLVQ